MPQHLTTYGAASAVTLVERTTSQLWAAGITMSLFCPTCANMLLVGRDDSNYNRWECSTCPYQFPIAKQMTTRVKLTRKQVDDIMGGEDAWKNVDSTDGEL